MAMTETRMKETCIPKLANHLISHKTHKYGLIASPGITKNREEWVAAGVAIIYDISRLKLKTWSVPQKGRIMKANFNIIGTEDEITTYAVYMPQRNNPAMPNTWRILTEDVMKSRYPWILGDLNAQSKRALRIRNKLPNKADTQLEDMTRQCDMRCMGSGIKTHRRGNELDHIIAPREHVSRTTNSLVLPWRSESDHSVVTSKFRYREDRSKCGDDRVLGTDIFKAIPEKDAAAWARYVEAEKTEIEDRMKKEGTMGHLLGGTRSPLYNPIRAHEIIREAHMQVHQAAKEDKRTKDNEARDKQNKKREERRENKERIEKQKKEVTAMNTREIQKAQEKLQDEMDYEDERDMIHDREIDEALNATPHEGGTCVTQRTSQPTTDTPPGEYEPMEIEDEDDREEWLEPYEHGPEEMEPEYEEDTEEQQVQDPPTRTRTHDTPTSKRKAHANIQPPMHLHTNDIPTPLQPPPLTQRPQPTPVGTTPRDP